MQNITINGIASFYPLFPVPVGCYIDDDFLEIKDQLLSMCYYEMSIDTKGRTVSNRLGWQSNLKWFHEDRNKLFYDYLHKMCEKLFYESFDHSGELSFTITDCWININPTGAYNNSHTHPGCDYTGVFYVNLPKDESPIVFDSHLSHSSGTTFSMYSEIYKNQYCLHSEVEFQPREGALLIFPSSLRHFVDENRSEDDRVSIALNICIEKYGRFGDSKRRGKVRC